MPEPRSKFTGFFSDMLDFVFPPLCLGCGQSVGTGEIVCERCLSLIDRYEYPLCLNCLQSITRGSTCRACLDNSFVLFTYGDYKAPMSEIIKQLKFKGITSPVGFFADRLTQRFFDAIEAVDADYLVPIPLHPTREYRRGYNQALLLAERLSELLGINIYDSVLIRTKAAIPQVKLRAEQRARNIHGVYSVTSNSSSVIRIILIDDVVTTGATASEARRVLTEAGFVVPAVISIAHGA